MPTLPPGPDHPSFVTTWNWLRRPYAFLDELAAKYGEAFSLHIAGLPKMAVFSNPEAVKTVFTEDGEKLHAGEFNLGLKPFLGEHSVLMLDGKEHMRQRRLLLPPFHGERMQAYGQTMLDVADDTIDEWPLAKPFSVHPHMQAITVRVIVRAILGIHEKEHLERVSAVIAKLLDLASWPPLLIPLMQTNLGRFSPWGKFLAQRDAADRMLTEEITRRRREGTAGRTDVLSLLIDARDESGRAMTDDELKDELGTLLVAGHETTATGLAWALRWILGTPAVERRLRAELATATLEQPGAAPLSAERIMKLELLDATVREALRLVPVIPIVGRVLKSAMNVGGYDLPEGTGVVCSIYLAQRRPSVWKEPAKFDPDRFLGKKFTPYEMFPFGGGIRRCIGMSFALYEMKMVLARVLARTRLRLADPASDIGIERRSITMMPSRGLRIVVEDRQPSLAAVERPEPRPPARNGAASRQADSPLSAARSGS